MAAWDRGVQVAVKQLEYAVSDRRRSRVASPFGVAAL